MSKFNAPIFSTVHPGATFHLEGVSVSKEKVMNTNPERQQRLKTNR
jgi:hypothetical protein